MQDSPLIGEIRAENVVVAQEIRGGFRANNLTLITDPRAFWRQRNKFLARVRATRIDLYLDHYPGQLSLQLRQRVGAVAAPAGVEFGVRGAPTQPMLSHSIVEAFHRLARPC